MIEYTKVKGSDLLDAIIKIEKALDGVDNNTALMGCIAQAIYLQDPNMAPDKLVDTIKTVSEYLALALSSYDTKVN